MDNILLCTNHVPLVTSIYNTFIEDYMPSANGSYVKVYLYLAKCLQAGEGNLSISSLADLLENTEKDIMRALLYWEKKALLQIHRDADTGEIIGLDMTMPEFSYTNDTSVRSADKAEHTATATDQPAAEVIDTHDTPSVPDTQSSQSTMDTNDGSEQQPEISFSPQQVQDLAGDGDFIWVCNVIESYLERPMKPNEVHLISYLYGTLHFSPDLLLHLYDYCISMGKTNSNYIQTVALSWHEQGITTPEEAQSASVRYHASYNAVSKALALGRSLAEVEKKFVDKWQNQWQMDLGVITEACDRTVLKLHHADFKYTDGILGRWHKEGVRTMQDVEHSDAEYVRQQDNQPPKVHGNKGRNQFQNFNQRDVSSEDLNELERKLLMQ